MGVSYEVCLRRQLRRLEEQARVRFSATVEFVGGFSFEGEKVHSRYSVLLLVLMRVQ